MGCGSSSASAPGKFNDDGDMECDGDRIRYDKKTGKSVTNDGGKDDDGKEDDFFEVNEEEGEQFMSVRPWIGQITEPDNHNPVDNSQPAQTYELEYVYGYRCADSKQNVYFNSQDNAVYMTAALGVILDHGSNTQKFFGGGEVANTAKNVAKDTNHHTDDVMCVSVNEARTTAVSGQIGASPCIFTWDACTGEKKNRMKIAKGARGITACDINTEDMICAVDLHNDHNVYCYDGSGNLVFKDKGDQNKIMDVAWDQKPGSKRFASAGRKHICFWDASQPGGKKTKGLYSGNDMTSFACVTWGNDGTCYTGGSNGSVYIWGGDDGRTCQGTIKAHKGFISAIRFVNGKLFTGGKDGKLNCIDTNTKTIESTLEFGFIRAIDFNGSSLLIGQRDGTITLCNVDGSDRKNIMSSHSDGEVWGLHQKPDGCIVTSGDDNKVMVWDPVSRTHQKTIKVSDRSVKAKRGGASTLSKLPDSQCSRAVTCNNDWIAIAGNDGAVSIRSMSSPDVEAHLIQDSREWCEVMAFSPDNQYLAVGSHDNKVYIYNVGSWTLHGKCVAHSSYIMAMDWCAESKYIRSNCGAYELLFFTVADTKQDPSGRSNTVATEWATKTVKFAWDVQGIYPSGCDGTHINSVSSSHDKMLFATGDDYGLVCLFRDPCIKGKPRSYRGHSEHVVRVMFGAGDSYLYSVGGYDQTLMQWKLALVAEEKEAARAEAERLVAEKAAVEEAARIEAQRIASQQEEARVAAEAAQLEAQRIAAEEAAKEAARLAAEKEAAAETTRLAEVETARLAAQEAEKEAARIEVERLAVEQAARAEAERVEAEKIAAEKETAQTAAALPTEDNLPAAVPTEDNLPAAMPTEDNAPAALPTEDNAPAALPTEDNVPAAALPAEDSDDGAITVATNE